jgi:signal peptidase II
VFRVLPLSLIALILAADLALGAWARATLQPGQFQVVIPHVLALVLVYNTGAAWSSLSGQVNWLSLLRLLVGLALLIDLALRRRPASWQIGLALIAAGALGNAVDGLLHGRVTDLLYSDWLSWLTLHLYRQSFPVFNLADSALVAGVIWTLLLSAWPKRAASPERPA